MTSPMESTGTGSEEDIEEYCRHREEHMSSVSIGSGSQLMKQTQVDGSDNRLLVKRQSWSLMLLYISVNSHEIQRCHLCSSQADGEIIRARSFVSDRARGPSYHEIGRTFGSVYGKIEE